MYVLLDFNPLPGPVKKSTSDKKSVSAKKGDSDKKSASDKKTDSETTTQLLQRVVVTTLNPGRYSITLHHSSYHPVSDSVLFLVVEEAEASVFKSSGTLSAVGVFDKHASPTQFKPLNTTVNLFNKLTVAITNSQGHPLEEITVRDKLDSQGHPLEDTRLPDKTIILELKRLQ